MLEVGVDKSIQVTVHNGLNITRLISCALVGNKGVGHKDVRTDLRAPLNVVLYTLNVSVNGQQFHLVHGFPSEDPAARIWERPEAESTAPIEDCIAIIGHAPTCYLTGNFEEQFRIWYGNGIIDIDCGCGNKTEHRRLACLRLDDMQEFYV